MIDGAPAFRIPHIKEKPVSRKRYVNRRQYASRINLSAEGLALMRQVKASSADVVGHSYSIFIGLQPALDHPKVVHSLALLEPALVGMIGR